MSDTQTLSHADQFFQLVQQTVAQTNDAAHRQYQAASSAVIAASAAETHAQAVMLISQTFLEAGGRMLQALEELQTKMKASPLARVMFRATYLVAARSVVELAARANGMTPEQMAPEMAPLLGVSAADLLATALPADTRRQLDQISAAALIEHAPATALPAPEVAASASGSRRRDPDSGRFVAAGTA